ncbi:hypothetical protein BASA81_005156 [Batrachochytrium salamandrivorans]|nr:hypothetical protein BASA81_005156 [Batrachochytrium salamandrivorans]
MTEMSLEDSEIGDGYVDPKDGLATCIDKLYEITKFPADRIKCSEVHKAITTLFKDASPQKIKVFMGNRDVGILKSGVNYYTGLRLKEDVEDAGEVRPFL